METLCTDVTALKAGREGWPEEVKVDHGKWGDGYGCLDQMRGKSRDRNRSNNGGGRQDGDDTRRPLVMFHFIFLGTKKY